MHLSSVAGVGLAVALVACRGAASDAGRDLDIAVTPSEPSAVAPIRMSTGLFALPADAVSVDWMVVNDAPTSQTLKVTVYRAGLGEKVEVPPGAVTATVPPGQTYHNANSVGPGKPFVPGFYYEVVAEVSDPDVLPSLHVWRDRGNSVIPGTLIPPGAWVRLRGPLEDPAGR